MRIRIGHLKRLINEVVEGQVSPGKYYVIKDSPWRPHVVVKVIDISESPRNPGLTIVKFKQHADGDSSMNIDAFMDRVLGEATPEEAEKAESDWAGELGHMAATIDTSREGT